MNHIVRTEAKRIYTKIRRRLSNTDAENINSDEIDQDLTSQYYREKIANHLNNK